MRPRSRYLSVVVALAGLAALALAAGFLAFAGQVTALPTPDDPRADGIVVLTGGSARIGEAIRLLEEDHAERLLISGVNPAVGADALARVLSSDPGDLLACCVDLGHTARDTIGNATETRAWVGEHGYRSLIVVTSDYHTPRALAEFGAAMPDIALVAYPVHNPELDLAGWWRDGRAFNLLAYEYVKYLLTSVRLALPLGRG